MRKNVRWLLPATAALGLLVGLSTLPARAADEKDAAAGKGTVTGTVVDKDGKPVADVKVNLIKPRRGGPGGPGGPPPAEGRKPADQADLGAHRANPLQAEGRPQRPAPVATATTDKDGKFEMKDVPAGDYLAAVRDEDKKVFGGARVTVKDGETATVEIKTSDKPMFGRGGRRGGGGGQGGNPGGGDQQK